MLFDGDGNRMTPSHAGKNGAHYRQTPIIARSAAIADSSWMDMLAGLSRMGNRRMPPGF
jgi:hypothetical protein